MSSKVEFLDKTEVGYLPSQEARQILGRLGIFFTATSFENIYRVASRDTKGRVYPYLAGFSEYGKTRKDWTFFKDGVEIGFYCTGLSVSKVTGRKVGEVGMVHIAPALRRKGLGTLVSLLGRMELVEEGAEIIRSVVGDETGAVLKLNKNLEFYDTGERAGEDRYPLWILPVTEKGQLLARLSDIFTQRAEKIRPSSLDFDPKDIDIDNPKRIPSIKELVNQRLKEKNYSCQEDRVLFGYHYAPVFLYLQGSGKFCFLCLQVTGNATDDAIPLEEIAFSAIPNFSPQVSMSFRNKEIFEVWSPELKTAEKIGRFALAFAGIGESFYRQCWADRKT